MSWQSGAPLCLGTLEAHYGPQMVIKDEKIMRICHKKVREMVNRPWVNGSLLVNRGVKIREMLPNGITGYYRYQNLAVL